MGALPAVRIGVLGLGTVGCGTLNVLARNGGEITRRAGRSIEVCIASARDIERPRDADTSGIRLTSDPFAVVEDPSIDIVVELIGGEEPARALVLRALANGKHVVTANKALIALHGNEVFAAARKAGVTVAFEAAVAGGIPVIKTLREALAGNTIQWLAGIINGTCNFILTAMTERGADFNAVLGEAQALGYAEADPTMDVDGTDAAQKLAILSHLAFGASVDWNEIPRVGIDGLDPDDLRYAKELGYRIKLLAVANLADDGLELSVAPTLVRVGTPLAEVRDAFNAIRVQGDAVGPVFYHGLGAGQMPTASAVVADLIDTAVGRTKITFRTLRYFSNDQPPRVLLRDADTLVGRYYLRLPAANHPGTLAAIANVLSKHGISIASVIQHESSDGDRQRDPVPLVIMTHEATEGAASQATKEIESLNSVSGPVVRLRVKG